MRRGALVVDVVLAAGTFTVVTAAMAADVGPGRQPDFYAYLWAAGLGALMFVRRQYPSVALAATAVGILGYYVAGYPPIGLAVPVAAALYSAAEAGKARPAVITAVALLTVSWGYRTLDGQDLAYLFGYELASQVAVMAAAIALGDGVASRQRWRAEHLRRLEDAKQQQRREMERRVEEERLALARDLHDVVAHTVAVISVQSDVAAEACLDQPEQALDAVQTIRAVSGQAMRDLRSTVELLREPTTDSPRAPVKGLGHLPALASVAQSTGLEVSIEVEGEPRVLPTSVDTTAYRILQEALTNTIRHAGASIARILIDYRADALSLEVSDNGAVSQPPAEEKGQGLRGMRERAALLGGTLEAGTSRDGRGFRVRARLPLGTP